MVSLVTNSSPRWFNSATVILLIASSRVETSGHKTPLPAPRPHSATCLPGVLKFEPSDLWHEGQILSHQTFPLSFSRDLTPVLGLPCGRVSIQSQMYQSSEHLPASPSPTQIRRHCHVECGNHWDRRLLEICHNPYMRN